jgi:membrane-associated phospholipid phosphatase
VLCALLVLPARLRPPAAALGALFAAAVGCSLLILAWHLPSDVVGGYLVAALWASLAVAGLRAHAAHAARLRSQRLGTDRRSAGAGVVGGAGTPAADGRAGPVGAGVP